MTGLASAPHQQRLPAGGLSTIWGSFPLWKALVTVRQLFLLLLTCYGLTLAP